MQLKLNVSDIVIIGVTLVVSFVGRIFSQAGMRWYYTINLPSWTPPSWVFGVAWSVIFLLTALAAMMVWRTFDRDRNFYCINALFALNACLNLSWTYLFFRKHMIGLALIDAVLLFFVTLLLLVLIGKRSLLTASLLAPYVGWLSFAIVLNSAVWLMN